MRTVLFLVAGVLFLAASLLLGRLFSSNYPAATVVATVVYVALWGLVLVVVAAVTAAVLERAAGPRRTLAFFAEA